MNALIKLKSQLQLNICFCYQKQEKWEESLHLLDKVLKIERQNGKAWYRKALSLEALQKIPEALESAATALNCAMPDQLKSKSYQPESSDSKNLGIEEFIKKHGKYPEELKKQKKTTGANLH